MELSRSSLEMSDYDVLSAEDGVSALRIIQRSLRPIHLVVANVEMAPMSGIQLASELKLLHAHVPVLLLSFEDELPADALGCWFLAKPARPSVLVSTVTQILGQQERHREPSPKLEVPQKKSLSSSQ